MELINHSTAELKFPKVEWSILRSPSDHEDLFLLGAKVGSEIFAWSSTGSSPKSSSTKSNVLLLDSDGSELEAYFLWMRTSFASQKPNDAEWISILKTLENHFKHDISKQPLNANLVQAMKIAGLEPHLGVLATRERFRFLNENEIRFLYEKKWDPSSFELFENLTPEIRYSFLKAIVKFGISATQARESTNHILMLTRKLGEKGVLTLLANDYMNGDELRLGLIRMAQPELYQMSQTRIEKLRSLGTPPRTSVFGDPNFESDSLKITHNPKSIKDFELFKAWVANPETSERFKDLFEVYKQ